MVRAASLAAVLSVVFGSACQAPGDSWEREGEPVELDSSRHEIIGGTTTTKDTAVVAIAANGRTICTGTLIGKQTVLTAVHCFLGRPPTTKYIVAFGTDISSPNVVVVDVAEIILHPGYTGTATTSGNGYDAAVLKLKNRISNPAPIRINPTPLGASDIGKLARHVGYGSNDGATKLGQGIRREVTAPITDVTPLEIFSNTPGKTPTCVGDSGGPALMVTAGNSLERVVGITSSGDANCSLRSLHTRVDSVAAFITSAAAAWENLGSCATDGVCIPGCTVVDQDCACAQDGVCSPACIDRKKDMDCLGVGAACTTASQCLGARCVVDDAQRPEGYCSSSCAAQDCPSGMDCVDAVCRFTPAPEVDLGSPCDAQTRCKQGVCAGPVGGNLECRPACEQGACTDPEEVCQLGQQGVTFCGSSTSETADERAGRTEASPTDSEVSPAEQSGCHAAAQAPWLGLAWLLLGIWAFLPPSRSARA